MDTSGRDWAAWRAEARATLALAWPLVVANLTSQLINATDVLLMGRLGAAPLAAATLALNLTWTLNMLLFGMVIAASPMMASALGQRSSNVRDVRRTFRAGLWLLILTLPFYWLALWHIGAVIRAFGQDPALADMGQAFMRAYMWSSLPWLVFQLLRNFAGALERPKVVLWLSLAGIPLNALLSWSLIFGRFGLPALGLVGGGVGSAITWAMLCAAMIAVVRTDRQFRRFHLFGRWWRFDRERVAAMVRLGLPIGATMMLEMGVFALATYFMGWLGAGVVAAHAIALQIASTTFMVPLGIGQAATVRVGLALGRGDADGVTRAGWTAWVIGVGFMSVTAVAMWVAPHPLVTLFLADAPANRAVIALAVRFLAVAALFQVVDGGQVIGAGMLRGLHDTRVPFLFALVGYWVIGLGIGAWLAFARDWRGVGIWTGLAAGLAVVAALMLWRWSRRGALGLGRQLSMSTGSPSFVSE
ncbi:MATE family efflux transporter [Sphingomonas sp. ASV193]|uniref:MATE family efflux transporter n=1 Tax=Sphingomonas sp. ASV193 TaxID=3144405 RepID=UPI0032E8C231